MWEEFKENEEEILRKSEIFWKWREEFAHLMNVILLCDFNLSVNDKSNSILIQFAQLWIAISISICHFLDFWVLVLLNISLKFILLCVVMITIVNFLVIPRYAGFLRSIYEQYYSFDNIDMITVFMMQLIMDRR